ncbi:MAG: ATP synthase F0 subunit B [Candidatus Gastranaerophilaceae bacterium]
MEFNATFLVSAISFIVFVFIMNTVLYRPVIRIMEERQAFLDKNEKDTEDANRQAEEFATKKEAELAKARAEAKSIVDNSTEKFKAENKAALDKYSSEQKQLTEDKKSELYNEMTSAKETLKQSSDDISRMITDKILEVKNV